MSREWKPGDVAAWTIDDGPTERIFRYVDYCDDNNHAWATIDSGDGFPKDHEIRPLVVIDPEDREQVGKLADRLALGSGTYMDRTQAALRSLIEPPKPEEPTGLGAVVEDADGNLWVRTYGDASTPDYECWKRSEFTTRHRYSAIVAVKVLSEGVTP